MLNPEKSKKMADVHCRGTDRATGEPCGEILYQSDGEYLYILGNALNKGLTKQHIECDRCGYTNVWRRAVRYLGKKIDSLCRTLNSNGGNGDDSRINEK